MNSLQFIAFKELTTGNNYKEFSELPKYYKQSLIFSLNENEIRELLSSTQFITDNLDSINMLKLIENVKLSYRKIFRLLQSKLKQQQSDIFHRFYAKFHCLFAEILRGQDQEPRNRHTISFLTSLCRQHDLLKEFIRDHAFYVDWDVLYRTNVDETDIFCVCNSDEEKEQVYNSTLNYDLMKDIQSFERF